MKNFEHILVPTDFGAASAAALAVALTLASKFDAEVTLLHTWEIPAHPSTDHAAGSIDLADIMEKDATGALAAALEHLQASLPRAKSVLKMGLPWQEIISAVQDLKVDLVVMGTHGRRGFNHLVLGSIAEKVVRLCPVPVLTVRGAPAAIGATTAVTPS